MLLKFFFYFFNWGPGTCLCFKLIRQIGYQTAKNSLILFILDVLWLYLTTYFFVFIFQIPYWFRRTTFLFILRFKLLNHLIAHLKLRLLYLILLRWKTSPRCKGPLCYGTFLNMHWTIEISVSLFNQLFTHDVFLPLADQRYFAKCLNRWAHQTHAYNFLLAVIYQNWFFLPSYVLTLSLFKFSSGCFSFFFLFFFYSARLLIDCGKRAFLWLDDFKTFMNVVHAAILLCCLNFLSWFDIWRLQRNVDLSHLMTFFIW